LSQADLAKWDTRYREGAYADRPHPTALLARYRDSFVGPALDVAAGAGRNALYLAEQGFAVDAIDISGAGLERLRGDAGARGLQVATFAADLEHGVPSEPGLREEYALIVMVRYVNMALLPSLFARLADGGMFLSEQHLQADRDVIGPANPAFRLPPNALLEACRSLTVHYYREGLVVDPDGRCAALAQIIASRGPGTLLAGGSAA
jgi:SAM-dependent methyltransferase